jgi:hypothetical protein
MSIEQAEKEKSLDYWNAVEGWVELPKAEQPTAWVYPEGLEALQQGKPWTAYGTDGNGPNSDGVERIPLYTSPQPQRPWVGLTEEEVEQIVDESTHNAEGYQFWCSGNGVAAIVEAKLKEKNT